MAGVVYDAGALIAADRGQPRMLATHRQILAKHLKPIVPLVVLAQVWRGHTHPQLSTLLKGCILLPEDLAGVKAAGIACAAAGSSDVVDALVVIAAVRHVASIVTSDPRDLKALADALGVTLAINVV